MSGMDMDPKIDEHVEKAAKQKEARIGFEKDGTMVIIVPLSVMDRPTARGVLLDADDIVKSWYAERARLKQKILRPGVAASMRNKLKGILH